MAELTGGAYTPSCAPSCSTSYAIYGGALCSGTSVELSIYPTPPSGTQISWTGTNTVEHSYPPSTSQNAASANFTAVGLRAPAPVITATITINGCPQMPTRTMHVGPPRAEILDVINNVCSNGRGELGLKVSDDVIWVNFDGPGYSPSAFANPWIYRGYTPTNINQQPVGGKDIPVECLQPL